MSLQQNSVLLWLIMVIILICKQWFPLVISSFKMSSPASALALCFYLCYDPRLFLNKSTIRDRLHLNTLFQLVIFTFNLSAFILHFGGSFFVLFYYVSIFDSFARTWMTTRWSNIMFILFGGFSSANTVVFVVISYIDFLFFTCSLTACDLFALVCVEIAFDVDHNCLLIDICGCQ